MELKVTLTLPRKKYQDYFTYLLQCGGCGKEFRALSRSEKEADEKLDAVRASGAACPACGAREWKKKCVFRREDE